METALDQPGLDLALRCVDAVLELPLVGDLRMVAENSIPPLVAFLKWTIPMGFARIVLMEQRERVLELRPHRVDHVAPAVGRGRGRQALEDPLVVAVLDGARGQGA